MASKPSKLSVSAEHEDGRRMEDGNVFVCAKIFDSIFFCAAMKSFHDA